MKKLLLVPIIMLLALSARSQNAIYGYINYDSLGLTSQDTLKVWLITYTGGTTTLAAVDSTTGMGWGHVQYIFMNKPSGSYMVKAKKLNQTVGTAGLMPTYHDSSLYWNTAQTFVHSGGVTVAHIWMVTGIVPSGPGFVAGNVSLGANKGTGAGVAGMNVFLLNASNKAILSTTTNANGDYSFSNVPAGTYSVYPEAMNYATTPATALTVAAGSTQVTGINFFQDDTKKNIKPHGLIVGNVPTAQNAFNIYPNPASGKLNLFVGGTNVRSGHIIITNAAGQLVVDKAVRINGQQSMDISKLTLGLYFVRGTEDLQGAIQKLIVE